jgi:uncharacterized membrane protein YbhN (UPF0104 family)
MAEWIDPLVFAVAVPLMAFVGLFLLASAVLMIYRDVLGFENELSERMGRQVGPAWRLWRTNRFICLRRFLYAGIAGVFAVIGYWFLHHGVVRPIGLFFFGHDIS